MPNDAISNRQFRSIAWTVVTILFVTAFLVVLAVDLILHGAFAWSGYAMIGIGGAWACSSLILLFLKRPSLIIAGQVVAIPGILVLVDALDGRLDWFLGLGIPITFMVGGGALLVYLLSKRCRFRVSMVFAFILVTGGLLCVGLDLLISGYRGNAAMTWSFVVLAATFPAAGLSMYYHFRIRKRFDLRKVFHL
jgi:hypothetical protein